MAKFASIHMILAIVACLDLELFQMDVKTAFLNGDLREEIYMDQPEGFQVEGCEDKVYKLKKTLYGLRQSSREWNLKFNNTMIQLGFISNKLDRCVYTLKSGSSFAILSLYVDDILLAGNDIEMLNKIKLELGSEFEMKDMGEASYVLGIEIIRDRKNRTLSLNQERYLRKVLNRFGMQNCSPAPTPLVMGKRLTKNKDLEEGQELLDKPYAEAVGSLMYAMLCTRPDLAYPVSLVSRYQSNPSQAHWEAVKRIMKYLKGTLHHKLVYRADALDIIGYSDADLGGDKDDGKSTSGHLFILGGAAVCWGSKKQGCVARYTQEAEYIACSMAATHAVWIRRFLLDLNLNLMNGPIEIYCDNTSAIDLIYSGANSSKGQHIEIQYHYIHDIVEEKEEVKVTYIPTTDMLADSLTKAIPAETFIKHVSLMGLRNT